MRTGIKFEAIEAVLNARPSTVKFEDKKNWLKFEGPSGLRLYVAKQKLVRQIDLSGFGKGLPGTIAPTKHNGSVEAHLDLASEDALINLALILEMMGTGEVKPTEKPKAMRPASSPKTPDAKLSSLSDLAEAEKEARLQLILKVAKEKGAPISKETEDQLLSVE